MTYDIYNTMSYNYNHYKLLKCMPCVAIQCESYNSWLIVAIILTILLYYKIEVFYTHCI